MIVGLIIAFSVIALLVVALVVDTYTGWIQ